jgi:hypothetical protein
MRFLSRIASGSPFAASPSQAMPRHVVDFRLEPERPFYKYTAGDDVRGAVYLTAAKPLRITHLVVALHGSVRTFRSETEGIKAKMSSAPPAAPNGPLAMVMYHGRGQASLFQDEQILSGEGRLEPQRYIFHFHLKLPEGPLPSSLYVGRGGERGRPRRDGSARDHVLTG